jgi:hypothetical protein
MTYKWLFGLALSVFTAVSVSSPARAGQEPGSLLVFPAFDNTNGTYTLLTVTNVNANTSLQVDVEFVYINGANCLEFNRTRRLTANDTITVVTNFDNPNMTKGYCYAFAKSITNGRAISWNALIGSQLIASSQVAFDFEVPAIVFKAISRQMGAETDTDHDNIRDLNDREYEQAPDRLLVPRFLGQTNANDGDLVLINLTGGGQFTAVVDFGVFNDNEQPFSAQWIFKCWTRVPLLEISGVFSNSFLASSGDNPTETQGLPVETGWFWIDGNVAFSSAAQFDDPAILALRTDHLIQTSTTGAIIPFCQGKQNNGDLLPRSLFGDTVNLP